MLGVLLSWPTCLLILTEKHRKTDETSLFFSLFFIRGAHGVESREKTSPFSRLAERSRNQAIATQNRCSEFLAGSYIDSQPTLTLHRVKCSLRQNKRLFCLRATVTPVSSRKPRKTVPYRSLTSVVFVRLFSPPSPAPQS